MQPGPGRPRTLRQGSLRFSPDARFLLSTDTPPSLSPHTAAGHTACHSHVAHYLTAHEDVKVQPLSLGPILDFRESDAARASPRTWFRPCISVGRSSRERMCGLKDSSGIRGGHTDLPKSPWHSRSFDLGFLITSIIRNCPQILSNFC